MTEETKTDITEGDEALPVVSIFDALEADSDAVENGKWFSGDEIWGPKLGHVRIKLRRMTSKASQKVRRDLELKYAKYQDNKGGYPEEIDQRMLNEQMAHAIIVDWKNIIDKDGKLIPYSREAAYMLCQKLPDFRGPLVAKAIAVDNFRNEEQQKLEGN